jgi:hypothetical protein
MSVDCVGSRLLLDVLLEHGPGEVSKTKAAVLAGVEEKVLGVNGLGLGHLNIDLAEIRGQAMAHEDTAKVQEEP